MLKHLNGLDVCKAITYLYSCEKFSIPTACERCYKLRTRAFKQRDRRDLPVVLRTS